VFSLLNIKWLNKNYLSAFDNDKPKLALWMNGGKVDEGKVITGNTLQLYDRKGFPEPTATDSGGNPITPSTALRTVNLIRVADKKTDKYYNFYLQSDTITLAMNYDPSLENPMVTRQGGSLKGTVSINGGAGFNGWAGRIEVAKPVSRPWVEWIKDELIDMEEMELTERESGRSYSRALGGIKTNVFPDPIISGFPLSNYQNIQDINILWTHRLNYHGIQFRGSLADTGKYWSIYLNDVGIPFRIHFK
jgi:hypothetical protein